MGKNTALSMIEFDLDKLKGRISPTREDELWDSWDEFCNNWAEAEQVAEGYRDDETNQPG